MDDYDSRDNMLGDVDDLEDTSEEEMNMEVSSVMNIIVHVYA